MSNAQSPLRTSLLLFGAGLVILSQIILQTLPVNQRSQMVWISLVGIALFLFAAMNVIANQESPSRIEQMIRQIADWLGVEDWQVIFLLSSPLLSWIAWQAAGEGRIMRNPGVAVTTWILGVAATMIGSFNGSIQRLKWEPRTLVLPLLLTIAAFLVRGLATDQFPIVLTGDEGSAGLEAVRFLQGEINNLFISTGYSFPSLFYMIQSLSVGFFGQTIEALRLPSAMAGALTVTALFFVGSAMFDRRTGTLAAIFLAAYHFHLHFSRIGLNNIWYGLWYIIVIGALWYGWEHEQNRALALAGLSLGIAQYFYPSGRALIIPILVWLFLMAVIHREKSKRVFPGILIMFTASLVVILPLALFYWHHPDEYMAPFARVSIFGPILDNMVQSSGQPAWLILLQQIWKSLQAFTYLPITAWYQPGTPLLRSFAAGLFLLGLLLLGIRGRESRFLLLALWILTFGLIGGFSESTPASQRYVATAPVCALLVGYGLSETASSFEKLWPQRNQVFQGLAIVCVVLIAVDELNFYFNTYTQKSVADLSHNNTMIAHRLADYLQDKPSDLQVVFMGAPFMGYRSIPSLQFLAPEIEGIDAAIPWESFDKTAITSRNVLFVFLPGNEGALETIRMQYPGGESHIERASDEQPLYWYYEYSSD